MHPDAEDATVRSRILISCAHPGQYYPTSRRGYGQNARATVARALPLAISATVLPGAKPVHLISRRNLKNLLERRMSGPEYRDSMVATPYFTSTPGASNVISCRCFQM